MTSDYAFTIFVSSMFNILKAWLFGMTKMGYNPYSDQHYYVVCQVHTHRIKYVYVICLLFTIHLACIILGYTSSLGKLQSQ